MFNPYQPYINSQQIIKVNGENGARAYAMSPSSSILLLDETAPRLFVKVTDGAGYPTISAYKLEPYVEEPAPDLNSLSARISKLEEIINAKSNTTNVKRKSKITDESEIESD